MGWGLDTSYNRYLNVFSPGGRLYQVLDTEYTGSALGGKDTSVVITQKKISVSTRLLITHLFNINPSIACLMTGLIAHPPRARAQVAGARSEAVHSPGRLALRLANINQAYTQRAAMSPLGIARLHRILHRIPHNGRGSETAGGDGPPGEKQKRLDGGKGAENAVLAGKTRSRAGLIELAIEVLSTVHATDYKPGEIEIYIVSNSEEEDPETRGSWRVTDKAEVEKHLLAQSERTIIDLSILRYMSMVVPVMRGNLPAGSD
ncbi:hypothetical protein D9611_001073 [Ephemerocybe angulata]|uniref:Proteasome alpha-type subunits domain-containing protein n=1 Tax=Ephemerocybe angulata TaxID=980116 RepID=A0A8H5BLV3_9AGAR|nr:hypothetical protein D9611_001073 [Tulosesus angulatus]